MTNFNFSSKFKYANIFSVILFFISIILIAFKGLNYGIDFKGGTLIELRSNNTEASSIRDVLKNMNLGDVNVKKFSEDALKLIEKADKNIMIDTINELEKIDVWEANNLEKCIKAEVKRNNIKMYDIAAPIRSSITGRTFSPSIFLVLEKLGKEVSIKRLKNNYYVKINE